MVDSPTDRALAEQIDDLTKRVSAVEPKLDLLSASVDRRFSEVDEALVQQRQYTELAFSSLETKMNAGFARLETRMDAGDSRLERKMDAGFDRLERKLDRFIDGHL